MPFIFFLSLNQHHFPHILPLLTHSFFLSTPPCLHPFPRFVLQLCQHSLSRSISFSGSLISCLPSNFTWPGVMWVWRDRQLLADHFIAQSSLPVESSLHKPMFFFLHWPLLCSLSYLLWVLFFFSWFACFSPPPLSTHPARERQGRSRDPLLFSPLFSVLSSSSSSSFSLSASLNSPSLIQLPGRRDSACSDCFTPHGPPSLSGSPLLW